MNNKEKYEIAFRMTTGASTGLSFVQHHFMLYPHTDIAFVRSIYILLSYNVELLLKSRVVMMGIFSDRDDIDKKLTSLSHDIIKISKQIGGTELLKLGIKKITKNDNQYMIKTIDDVEIHIEDFVDIRYDYIYGKNRVISHNEHENIMKYVKNLLVILQRVKTSNENDKNQKSGP